MVTYSERQRFVQHLEQWTQNEPIICEIPRTLLITILSQLQLATKHPDNPRQAKQLTIRFINQIIAVIETEDPMLAEILRKARFNPN